VAEKLALDGCSVRLVSEGSSTGEALPNYTRDAWIARCHKLGVEFISHGRIYGANGDTSYFVHALSGEPILLENTDTLVLSTGHSAVVDLEHSLQGLGIEHVVIGDCVSPRSAEEAVYEGWIAGLEV
jgi:hypothetical protein